MDTSQECYIILRSPDTDVLILSVAQISDINCAEFWFKTGVQDGFRYVPVHAISQELGEMMFRSLLASHAITGCDPPSALARIDKKKGLQVFSRSEQHQYILGLLGSQPNLSDHIVAKCEDFICDLYQSSGMKPHSVDELRYFLFCQKKQKGELLPPASDSLLQELIPVNYQTYIILEKGYDCNPASSTSRKE